MTRVGPSAGWPKAVWQVGFALASVLLLLACGEGEGVAIAEPEGDPAPEFALAQLQGRDDLSLASLRGKVVVIDFWATWCAPCKEQVPVLNAFFDAHRDDSDVAVLGISVDTDGPEEVTAWVIEMGVRYPIALGDEDLARRYGVLGFPALVMISPDGRIAERHLGRVQAEPLEAALQRLRAG